MECEYAKSRRRDLSLTCTKMQEIGRPYPFCSYQYYCGPKGKWIVKDDARNCPLRAKTQKHD